MALRITVLDKERVKLGWLAVGKKPGNYSIADGSHERNNHMSVNMEQTATKKNNPCVPEQKP
jgi:hypothetical protein